MPLLSWSYLCFVVAVAVLYFRLRRTGQNALLLAASLAFSATWDYRGALLLVASSIVDFAISRRLDWELPESVRRRALWLSVIVNVGTLASIKYARFWIGHVPQSFVQSEVWHTSLSEQLRGFAPVGLSFYTLARLTHTFDVYYRLRKPADKLLEFLLFVSFFPQLTAGPIDRARNVLPQLAKARDFDLDRTYGALWLIGLGLFKKVYVADHAGLIAWRMFVSNDGTSATATWMGLYAYAIQIYGDFAGYSDIARGTARLFGIDIMSNFSAPYWSANLAEYWRRWHISLSTFLEDYIDRPVAMALRDLGDLGWVLAIWVTFLASGLWHGTGWTFLIWAAIHAAGLTVYALTRRLRKRAQKRLPPVVLSTCARLLTFHYVCLGYLFFRAGSLKEAWGWLRSLGAGFSITFEVNHNWNSLLFYAAVMALLDYLEQRAGELWIWRQQTWVRTVVYAAMMLSVVRLFAPSEDFIYAEF